MKQVPPLTEEDITRRDDEREREQREDFEADVRAEKVETVVLLALAVLTVAWAAFLTVGTLYLMGEIA